MALELAPYYSDMLLQAYPALVSVDQLRHAYAAMVDCLAEQDEAYAWLVVQRLIDAIDAIPPMTPANISVEASPEDPAAGATAVARGHLLVTLCDQLRVVSLAQFDQLLAEVRRLLLAETASAARTAVVKILFDDISQQLDFTRKEHATKWYLSLATELGISGAL
ncbi:hypothetical protein THASP1DRAFT_27915 [Thamnocephalis sphaerospora]|uniref:Uncharacterized protein n=1 Tax=Thamnocephalis sphaerospora TaxID=78915 RepID=A0A4P9XVL2_9FUNG|nr:hypothetical protein THASP1DRAFT_27915 [Thamnocephalis sphaerospora]|eukprot:RKP10324.1 hypothetical protein THASP1DRAFT_27915 [Thamnocephalis sphaerospora]